MVYNLFMLCRLHRTHLIPRLRRRSLWILPSVPLIPCLLSNCSIIDRRALAESVVWCSRLTGHEFGAPYLFLFPGSSRLVRSPIGCRRVDCFPEVLWTIPLSVPRPPTRDTCVWTTVIGVYDTWSCRRLRNRVLWASSRYTATHASTFPSIFVGCSRLMTIFFVWTCEYRRRRWLCCHQLCTASKCRWELWNMMSSTFLVLGLYRWVAQHAPWLRN